MFSLTPWRKERSGTELTPRGEHPLNRLQQEFNSLFDQFLGRWPTPFQGDWNLGWGLDVEDVDKEFVVRAEAPGFEAEDFDIQLCGNTLTIKAERKHEAGEKEDDNGYSYSERRLHRTVTLPAGAEMDNVTARYRNGVLELHLPKSPEAQGKRIEVKAE